MVFFFCLFFVIAYIVLAISPYCKCLHSPQLTLNLALGVIFVLITLVVLIACIISSLANIPQAVCEGPGFESGTLASPKSYAPIYSSIAQSVERMTVNHESPVPRRARQDA